MTENLSDLLGRVSKNSTGEIDSLIGEFERLRGKLQTDGERIQHEIEEYAALSQQVMQLTKTIPKAWRKFDHQWIGLKGNLRKKKIVLSDVGQARRDWARRACTLRMRQPLICGVPMKPDSRRPNTKRRQPIQPANS